MAYRGTSWKTKILKEREKAEKARLKELAKENKGEKHHCYDCKFAYLMQSTPYNPIVSECTFDKDREVARMFVCTKGKFEKLDKEEDRIIHDMIYLNKK